MLPCIRNATNSKKSEYESVKVGTYVSDVSGYFKIEYLRNDDYRNFSIYFSKGDDLFSTEPVDHQSYYYSGSIYQYKEGERHTQRQTFFFMDRAIYRPGQSVYFKGLVITTDGKNSMIQAELHHQRDPV